MTLDMDIVIDFPQEKVEDFCQRFKNDFYVDSEGIREAIRQRNHFNIIHAPSGSKVDFYQLKDDPLNRQMFKARHQESFQNDKMAYFSRPEDVIIHKLIFYKEGQSEKHLRDIQGMLRVSGGQLDLPYIEKKTKELSLYPFWEKLKSELG